MRGIIVFLVLVICLTCFSGCQNTAELREIPQNTMQVTTDCVDGSEETIPELVDVEKIAVTPWDSGRANETSGNKLWEVEKGYYLEWNYLLYYADKSDLSQWIPVCTKADCTHERNSIESMACDASVASAIILKGDRIYFDTKTSKVEELKRTELYSTIIGSMALDGSDKRLEYYIAEAEDKFLQGEMFVERSYLLENGFVYATAVLNREGTYEIAVYYLDDEGCKKLFETTRDSNAVTGRFSRTSDLYGDEGFFEYALEQNANILYRIQDRQVYGVDLTDIPWNGGYLAGDILLAFVPGDGYYQIDLRNDQRQKIADCQMDNSFSHMIAPNCILESTVLNVAYLSSEALETRKLHPVEEHTMRFYDGEQWMDVELPEEVRKAKDEEALTPIALMSDRILLSFTDISVIPNENPAALYQILLTTDTPTLEYLGTIG